MKTHAIITFIYSVLLLIGGLIGYLKAGSMVSIIMAAVFALLLVACGIAMWKGLLMGYFGGLGIACILTLFFLYRFMLSYRFMPAGLMVLIGFVVLLSLIFIKRHPS